ncbi:hypothetical protein [Halomonas sp.]|uniref:hypothetical protein n=1 Tax=Halomonas sp. TaxID=1486246 RepID=UPI003D1285D0
MRIPLLWTSLLAVALPLPAIALTGQVTGHLEGEGLDVMLADGVNGLPAIQFESFSEDGFSMANVGLFALEEQGDETRGALLFLTFEAEGDLSPDTLVDAVVMVAGSWATGAESPEQVWMAEMDRADVFEIERLEVGQERLSLAGRMASDHFCLHDMPYGDPVAVRQDGDMICKPGALEFSVVTEEGPASTAAAPVEMEVLGRIDGRLGDDHYDWLTIVSPDGGAVSATATFSSGAGADLLRLRGHSPASANYLTDDVLAIDIAVVDGITEGATLPADVTFFVDGMRSFYSAQDGDGEASAEIQRYSQDGDGGELKMTVAGRLCRVEGQRLVEGDCRVFEARVESEVLRADDH